MPRATPKDGKQDNSNPNVNWLGVGITAAVAGGAMLLGAVGGFLASEVISNEKDVPEEKQVIQTETTTNTNECVICMEEITREIAFVPCGHCRCCSDCGSLVTNCPICRKPITSRQALYHP